MIPYHQDKTKLHGNAKYTSGMVAQWRVLKRENKWSSTQLATHLKMGYKQMMNIIQKDARGELPT